MGTLSRVWTGLLLAAWATGSLTAADKDEAKELIARMPKMSAAELVKALSHKEIIVRNGAAGALGRLGPKAKEAIPALAKVLTGDSAWQNRGMAAQALAQIGAVKELAKGLDDKDFQVRGATAELLGLSPKEAKIALKKLQALYDEEKNESVRGCVAVSLAWINPEDKTTEDRLTKAIRSESLSPRQKFGAVRAMYRLISPKKALALTIELTKHKTVSQRLAAIDYLGAMGRTEDKAVQELIKVLNPKAPRIDDRWLHDTGRAATNLRLIGNKKCYAAVKEARDAIGKFNIDYLKSTGNHHPKGTGLGNHLAALLMSWPKDNSEQAIRQRIKDLEEATQDAKIRLPLARKEIQNYKPGTALYESLRGEIKGLTQGIAQNETKLQEERANLKAVLAKKQK